MANDSPEMVGTEPYRFRKFIDRFEIYSGVKSVAEKIGLDYENKNPLLVGVLNGSFIFMADLVRSLPIPCEIDFVKLSSYGSTMQSVHMVLQKDLDIDITNRHLILVEDIVDTGNSVQFLLKHFLEKKPASLAVATMFLKPRSFEANLKIDYVGMEIPDDFVVGYGLDYAQQWRQLPELYVLDEDKKLRESR